MKYFIEEEEEREILYPAYMLQTSKTNMLVSVTS
jgi:hypothetical protein